MKPLACLAAVLAVLMICAACLPSSCGGLRKPDITFAPIPPMLLAVPAKPADAAPPKKFLRDKAVLPVKQHTAAAHKDEARAVAFTPDGAAIVTAGYGDFRLCIWDAKAPVIKAELRMPARPVDMAVSPDGASVLVVDAARALTRVPITGGVFGRPQALATLPNVPRRLAVHPGGRIAVTTSATESAVLVWDLQELVLLQTLHPAEPTSGTAFSPDGRWLATGTTGRSVVLWELAAGRAWAAQHKRAEAKSDVAGVAWHPGGTVLAAGHMDSSVALWQTARLKQLSDEFLSNGSAFAAAFAPAGEIFVTAHSNGKVGLWDGADGSSVFALPAHTRGVRAVAFSPDGARLATVDEGGALVVWRAP